MICLTGRVLICLRFPLSCTTHALHLQGVLVRLLGSQLLMTQPGHTSRLLNVSPTDMYWIGATACSGQVDSIYIYIYLSIHIYIYDIYMIYIWYIYIWYIYIYIYHIYIYMIYIYIYLYDIYIYDKYIYIYILLTYICHWMPCPFPRC